MGLARWSSTILLHLDIGVSTVFCATMGLRSLYRVRCRTGGLGVVLDSPREQPVESHDSNIWEVEVVKLEQGGVV
jgi:hypothetical protein